MRIAATRHVAERFSRALNRGLFRYYGRNPSAAMVARDFNLRSRSESPISQEASRKWMRGLTVPELAKMQVLAEWLNLDLRTLDAGDEPVTASHDVHRRSGPSAALDAISDVGLRERLVGLIGDLDRPSSELVLSVMLGLVRLSASQPRARLVGKPPVAGDPAISLGTVARQSSLAA